ncbi:MAG TPA: glutamine synthetase [Methanothrix sp.]|nr:glutamine synthetase [Methanothrix sp.]HQE87376.1 glutamine synthetase [Methanothrix sp.]HQI68020.1 glutamine synthetase [Methanothrix sp.]HRS84849.1 glutamine synthetase [Methanothrix sp.]HRT16974.1 glutamine synthetase [Methanothrix sp.]
MNNVRVVSIWFTDILGVPKSFAINPSELEGAFSEGMGFDGSSIQGFTRIHEPDMVAKPDPATFQIIPWRQAGERRGTHVLRHTESRRHTLRGRSEVHPQERSHAPEG